MRTIFLTTLLLFSSLFAEEVTPKLLRGLFQHYYGDDPLLKKHIESFPFQDYSIYLVEGRDVYYVDEVPDLIKNFIRKGILWELDVWMQLARYVRPHTVAIDIGGHIGTQTLPMSRFVGKVGKVYVFEPQIKIFSELVINMHLNNVKNTHFFRKALGASQGFVEMNPYCSENEGGLGIGKGGDPVEKITLDSLNLNNVSFIKIDVEGNEEEVIEGARKTILRNKPVMVVEIMGGVFYETATSEQKVEIHRRARKIQDLGYIVTHMGLHNYLCTPTCELGIKWGPVLKL